MRPFRGFDPGSNPGVSTISTVQMSVFKTLSILLKAGPYVLTVQYGAQSSRLTRQKVCRIDLFDTAGSFADTTVKLAISDSFTAMTVKVCQHWNTERMISGPVPTSRFYREHSADSGQAALLSGPHTFKPLNITESISGDNGMHQQKKLSVHQDIMPQPRAVLCMRE